MDDTNKNILEKITEVGFKVEDKFNSNSLHENLEEVNIQLSDKEFESFETYLCKHKHILDVLEYSTYCFIF